MNDHRFDHRLTIDDDALVAYALGILDEGDTAHVEAYLADHPEALERVRSHLDTLTEMVLNDEPSELPAGAEADLLAAVRNRGGDDGEVATEAQPILTAPPPRRRGRSWLALAAVVALLVVGSATLRPLAIDAWVEARLRRYQTQPGADSATLLDADGARLGVLIRLDDDRAVVALDETPPDGLVYQAWEITEGQDPRSRGTWRSRLFTSPPLADGNLFGISVEPRGGSSQPTTTPIVVLPL